MNSLSTIGNQPSCTWWNPDSWSVVIQYIPLAQANVSEAEPQKQAMWNCRCSHKRRASRILCCYHLVEILQLQSTARISLVSNCRPLKLLSGGNSVAEIHSENFCLSNCSPGHVIIMTSSGYSESETWIHSNNFPSLRSFVDSEGHSKRKERLIRTWHPCRDGSVSSGWWYWLLYVLHISKGNISAKLSGTWANAKKYTVRISNQESWRLKMSNPITKNSDN